ncbi:hypothetical protein [Streptomyces flaveolus]|uniref:hypothetical protein n=1 Tax=Streptomyces flaveolus TaxID=67297 RepID=UPI0033D69237
MHIIASLLRTGMTEFDGRYFWAHGGELRPRGVRPASPPRCTPCARPALPPAAPRRVTAGVNVVPTSRADLTDPGWPVLTGTPADLAAGYRDLSVDHLVCDLSPQGTALPLPTGPDRRAPVAPPTPSM